MHTSAAVETTTPVGTAERMTVLDAVRGVAVLGILIINVEALTGYAFLPAAQKAALPLAEWDDPAWFLLAVLVEAKFYSLFSFLFGVGFAVFIQRARARGADDRRLFKRRLVGLLLIGLAHSLLIWFGDILATYAVLGFALLLFIRKDDRTVLRWAAALLALPVALYAIALAAFAVFGPAGAPADAAADDALPPILASAAAQFATGTYSQVLQGNVVFTIANVVRRFVLMFFPRVVGMFLVGFYAGRRGIFADIEAHRPLLRRVCWWGLAAGLPLNIAVYLLGAAPMGPPSLAGLIDAILRSIGVPLLAMGYAAGLTLLFHRRPRLMHAVAPVGRMALTNYLLHSVVAVIVFYGIGFGLYGTLSLGTCMAGALALFVVQMAVSRLWLARAAFGPAEWLWRWFTYGRRIALLK